MKENCHVYTFEDVLVLINRDLQSRGFDMRYTREAVINREENNIVIYNSAPLPIKVREVEKEYETGDWKDEQSNKNGSPRLN